MRIRNAGTVAGIFCVALTTLGLAQQPKGKSALPKTPGKPAPKAAKNLPGGTESGVVRRLPPGGIEISDLDRKRLEQELNGLTERIRRVEATLDATARALLADITVFTKAVRLALDLGEFYRAQEVKLAGDLLKRAAKRLDDLQAGSSPWRRQTGLVVRGFSSQIDGSPQPYGLVIPDRWDFNQPARLDVWLHGRGDTITDLAFLSQRESSVGQIKPANTIVLHPFGRYCNAFKFAGETDVLEAIDHVCREYKIDNDRIVLRGFSMGGAGAWSLAAHYPGRFLAVNPGAGFVDTARYLQLKPSAFPPPYEQTLWGWTDVPPYVQNLFQLPVIAYSGENDKQRASAEIMAETFRSHGKTLTHIIGPGVEHKIHPDSQDEIERRLAELVAKGRDRCPPTLTFQTRTLKYNELHWLKITGLDKHWLDSTVDARRSENRITIRTTNVNGLELHDPWPSAEFTPKQFVIDGYEVGPAKFTGRGSLSFTKVEGEWYAGVNTAKGLRKKPGLQGPIDDAFTGPFLVVRPSGTSRFPGLQKWVDFERKHFLARWRALMRGEPRVKLDHEVTAEDIKGFHLIVWGDPDSNAIFKQAMPALPIAWQQASFEFEGHKYDRDQFVPVMVYPNPLDKAGKRYLVINSGITFREGHDTTNSLQTAKLPDWAVLDLRTPPDALQPGKVAAAGFFDETWK